MDSDDRRKRNCNANYQSAPNTTLVARDLHVARFRQLYSVPVSRDVPFQESVIMVNKMIAVQQSICVQSCVAQRDRWGTKPCKFKQIPRLRLRQRSALVLTEFGDQLF
jgi:hypothetical protein